MSEQETIVSAALRFSNLIVSAPPPARHHSLFRWMDDRKWRCGPMPDQQGFLTSRGRFVERREAARIAHAAGQIANPKDELFSEDLW